MTLGKLVDYATATVGEIVLAYLVALIAPGGTLTFAKLVLAFKLNVFALPLSWTPALSMPAWCWYVVAVVWIRQWLYLSPYSARDAAAQLEDDYAALRGRWS